MDVSVAGWLVIALALAGANLPFLLPRPQGIWARLFLLLVLYFVVLGIGHGLESSLGNAFVQTWEFYPITACLFLVLAFPGFVLRYLRKHRHPRAGGDR
ncbi:MAG: DUF2818 family protein [Telluria sp.]